MKYLARILKMNKLQVNSCKSISSISAHSETCHLRTSVPQQFAHSSSARRPVWWALCGTKLPRFMESLTGASDGKVVSRAIFVDSAKVPDRTPQSTTA